jgi:hypothetical protein
MTVGKVIKWLVAPHYQYELVVLEVRRAVIDDGNINRGGQCPVHMGVEFANLFI